MGDRFKQHGAFSWFELMTTDTEGAKTFYTNLFGWETEDMNMGDTNYTVLNLAKESVGGLIPMPPPAEGMPPTWGIYVTVDDVDATAAKAEKLGGKVMMPPTDIPNVGRFCVLQDPQGAAISAITYTMRE